MPGCASDASSVPTSNRDSGYTGPTTSWWRPFGEYETQTTMQTTDSGARAYHIVGGASTLAQDLMQKWVSEWKDS